MDNEDKLHTAKEYVNWFNNNKDDLVSSQMFIDYLIDEIFGVTCKDVLSEFTDVDGIIEDKNVFGKYLGNIDVEKCINIYGKNNWISITNKLPNTGQKVRVLVSNKYCNFFTEGLATYISKHTIFAQSFLSEDVDEDFYDISNDGTEYTPEGFYDYNLTAEADSFLLNDVVYWQLIVKDYPEFTI